MRYTYPCNIILDEEGLRETGREGYVVNFPDVYGANTGGDTWMKLSKWPRIASVSLLVFISMKTRSSPPPAPPQGPGPHPRTPFSRRQTHYQFCDAEKRESPNRHWAKSSALEKTLSRRLLDPNSRHPLHPGGKGLRAVGRSLIVEDAPITAPARIPVAG